MCPFCLATAAVVAASATGTGGVAALVTGKLLRRISSKTFHPKLPTRRRFNMATMTTAPKLSKAVSHSEWIEARRQFLAKEKEFTRLRDELSRQRRELPWEKIEKNYVFEGPRGKETLADLFDGRSQLVIYHFMLGPGWAAGCPSCSYLSDHFDGMTIHLAHRDVTLAVVSRAPYAEIDAFKKRMGWKFHWASSFGIGLQLRLSRFGYAGGKGDGNGRLQLHGHGVSERGTAGCERVLQRCGRPDLPHVLNLCARARHPGWHL